MHVVKHSLNACLYTQRLAQLSALNREILGMAIIPGQRAENKILWGAQFYMEQPYDILSSEDLGVMSGDRSERLFETGC